MNRITSRSVRFTGLVSACVAACTLAGCSSAPQGSSGGRVPSGTTTPAEVYSPQPTLVSMDEFKEQVAAQLIYDLSEVPELNDPGAMNYIVLGDIVNKTDIVSTAEFEAIRVHIRQRLNNSREVLANTRFLQNRAALESIRARERPAGSPTGRASWDDMHTFYLNGEMYRQGRGNVNQYTMTFNLLRDADGIIVWESLPYDGGKQISAPPPRSRY
ncbi:MAG: hypothetical protein H6815_05945 [Phycisphaeraceae bacterium]|nr:hypothetical protein [Phycisphaerales bacterium]MCB9859981.1 hypothetical protein [Phycisphaeraceae bacterium]